MNFLSDNERVVAEAKMVILTDEQKNSCCELLRFVFDCAEENYFISSGAAGTGKSFTIGVFVDIYSQIRRLRGQNTDVACVAPTHKASGVLADAFVGLDIYPCIGTLHQLLHLIPGDFDEKGNRKMRIAKKSHTKFFKEYPLIVIDEYSMITTELLDFIQSNTGKSQKIIFSGDKYQLPPVEKFDEELPKDGIHMTPVILQDYKEVSLINPVRYAGELAQFASLLRQSIDDKAANLLFPEDGGNLHVLNSNEWNDLLLEKVKEDISNTRAIAWTNKRVNVIANSLREQLYGDTEYHEGEILISKEPVVQEKVVRGCVKEVILMGTCQEAKTIKVSSKKDCLTSPNTFTQINLEWCELTLESVQEKQIFTVLTPFHKDIKEVREFFKKEKEYILGSQGDKGKLWREYYRMLSSLCLSVKNNTIVPRLSYAGVMTINTSQGSGYPHVFVDWLNIFGCQNYSHRLRLAYTALTRAKSDVYILAKKESLTSLFGTPFKKQASFFEDENLSKYML
jgi:AAA domain/UvrD-like helicase C-terminal domain